jgi:glutaminase
LIKNLKFTVFRHHLQGIDLNTPDYDGRTAIHVAAAEGQMDCVKFLLETAEVNASPKDRWNFTPLEEARRFGHDKVADYIEDYHRENGIVEKKSE